MPNNGQGPNVPGQNKRGDVLAGNFHLGALLQRVLDLAFDDVTVGRKLFGDGDAEEKSGLGLDQLQDEKQTDYKLFKNEPILESIL